MLPKNALLSTWKCDPACQHNMERDVEGEYVTELVHRMVCWIWRGAPPLAEAFDQVES
jgi:hypothetical protein